ncbi:MAG: hypothetical protein ACRESR_07545 [Gammaproteobacteria bacterium]
MDHEEDKPAKPTSGTGLFEKGTEYNLEPDKPAKSRPELPNEAALTEQDTEYRARTIPPLEQRLRHWHHWRTGGILCALAGIFMIIGSAFSSARYAMEVGAFVILAGAVSFTVGVIGGWTTRQRPLD